jgi:hypothetical protein
MTRVHIDTEVVKKAANTVASSQHTIGDTWTKLATALATAQGMGGNPGKDPAAAKFVPAYAKAASAAWQGFAAIYRSVGEMSGGLTQTAKNHERADRHSIIGKFSVAPKPPGSFLDQLLHVEVAGPLNVPAPSSAAGPGKEAPRSLLETLTGINVLDISKYWATGDEGQLNAGAAAWRTAGDSLIEERGRLVAQVKWVTDQGDAPDIDAFGGYWSKLFRNGDPNTILEGLPQLCTSISRACSQYSAAVLQAHMQLNDIGGNPIAAVLETAALRAALAEAAGELAQAAGIVATGVLAQHLITSVTIGASNAPNLRILEAAMDDEEFAKVLEEWDDPFSDDPDEDDLEENVRKIAKELGYTPKEIDQAIHAVKAHGDWRGLGDNKNPDVLVDLSTGNVYPQTATGAGESSIGNIYDYLRNKR